MIYLLTLQNPHKGLNTLTILLLLIDDKTDDVISIILRRWQNVFIWGKLEKLSH